MPGFSKYEDFGAYHWRGVRPQSLLTYNPRLAARYKLALRMLEQEGALNGRPTDGRCFWE